MKRFAAIVLFASAISAPVLTQSPPQARLTFEVASIKPYDKEPLYSFRYAPDGGFRGTLPLEWLIGIAYDITPFERIVGEPGWARTQFFEIEGKPAAAVSRAETLAMLRTLIEERFGLVWRRDPSGTAVVYALTMAREDKQLGPGIRPSGPECLKHSAVFPSIPDRQLRPGAAVPCGSAGTGGVFAGGGMQIRMVASMIQLAFGEEVVDRTGLTGSFDFYMTLPRGQNPDAQDAVSIFTAVQEQLGMKLQREIVPRDVFIVEAVSRPTPN